MIFYTLAVNSVFVFLIAGGFPVRPAAARTAARC